MERLRGTLITAIRNQLDEMPGHFPGQELPQAAASDLNELTKAVIMQQLDEKGIEYSPKQRKSELLELLLETELS